MVPDPQNAFGISFSPAAATFNGKMYIFHQGRGNDGRIWYCTNDGRSWGADTQLPEHSYYYPVKNSPAVAVFQNKLFVAYHNENDQISVGWLDSSGIWHNMPGATSFYISYSPALAVYNDRLYMAYQGSGDTAGKLMITSTDGNTWTAEEPVGASLTGSPGLVAFQGILYCFHKGTTDKFDTQRTDYIEKLTIKTAKIAAPGGSELVAAVAAAGVLGVAGDAIAQGITMATNRRSDWTWVTSYDANAGQWVPDYLCPSSADAYGVNSEGIAVIEYQNRLICIRQGRDNSQLWCGGYANGGGWSDDVAMGVPGNTYCTTGAPGLAVLNGTLYCFHQCKNDGGWMMLTTIKLPAI